MSEPGSKNRGKILVIDDDTGALQIARRNLESAGYSVVTSESALRLPAIVQMEHPDLILLDIEMPALRGDQVMEMVKLFDFLDSTRIVLHSSKNESELPSIVTKSSAAGFIKKTSNPLEFIRQVEHWLRAAVSKYGHANQVTRGSVPRRDVREAATPVVPTPAAGRMRP